MQNNNFPQKKLACAISVALLMAPVSGYANDAEATQEKNIDSDFEVISVTANRRTQSIQEVPYNISAISGAELEKENIIDASEMMRNIPGINVVDRGYRNSGTVNGVVIRGVNVDGATNGDIALSAVPTVASYINDTPLYANFILKDIEAVEVLRGPQGTLYGSGSLAGTVRYRMNRPDTRDFYGSASLNVGQTKGSEGNNINADVMVNIPLSDNLAVRANIGKIDNDGIVDYVNIYQLDANNYAPVAQDGDIAAGGPLFTSVEDADTVDITYGRVSLGYENGENFKLLLAYQWQEDDIGGRRQVTRGTNWVDGTEHPYGEYENGAVQLEPSERDVDLLSLEMEWDLGFATLTSSTSDYSHEGSSISDNTGFYAKQNWFADLYYGSPRPMAQARRGYKEEALVQEIRLVSNETKANMDWIVGAYYMDQDTFSTQDSLMPGYQEWAGAAFSWWPSMADYGMVYTDNDFRYRRNQNFKDKALFAELTYHMSDDLRTTVGIRRFDNEFVNDTELSLPIWPFLGAEPEFKTDESDTLFKFNLAYDVNKDMMAYLTVSEGYRRGGANAVPLEGSLAERPEWQTYESDSAVNYEVGIKGYLGDRDHSYSLTAYRIDWDNPQLNAASYWGFFTVANGESARTQGLEFELKGYLTESVRYVFGYAHVSAELTDDFYVPSAVTAESPTRLTAEDGDKLPSTPENMLSLSLDHTHDLDNGWYLISQVNAYYQSDSLNFLGNNEKLQTEIDGFSLWNASVRLSADDWDVVFYVKNVFNDDGVTGLLPEAYMGTDPAESFYGNSSKDYITLPRTFGLSATYRF
ncbi:TonB-dependent receptor [Aestuariibacter halophilus]|uniref:TonB-dependent receptor n=1 Tax=Fluctibacter halophilus TaxID=226011 RepID=A0ABS8G637_9ALTE|nr:TonB-dependent receptor [Aestuariibacter halophilus]MCC2614671.1 TonB-dependent receptor [Aestuariibacter halophilus]